MFSLAGKKALVVGVANDSSIAFGCAKAFRKLGADLAVTYLNEKAESYVKPLAEQLSADIFLPLDVSNAQQEEQLFKAIEETWGQLDVLLHSVAFCRKEDLHGRIIDSSAEGFSLAMDVSVHSFLRLIKRAEPLMKNGGSCMTVSFYGSEKVVEHYNIMGAVKAALESVTRYAAAELGRQGIRVNALSPGPMATRAASGINHFDELMERATDRAPTHTLSSIEDVGAFAAFLASDNSRNITGYVHMIDGGYSIIG